MLTPTSLLLLLLVAALTGARRLADRGDTWRLAALSDQAGQDTSGGTDGFEKMGACKATCVQEMLNWPPSDKQCLENDQCVMCWQLCELLYQDELKWRQRCGQKDCTIGCSLACDFDFEKAKTGMQESWEFPSSPVTMAVDDSSLHFSWPRPSRHEAAPQSVSRDGQPMPVFLVYTLLFKDDRNPYWSKATSTVNQEADVAGPHTTLPGLTFLLLATSTSGPVSVGHPPYPGLVNEPAPTTTTTKAPSTLRPVVPGAPVVPHWDPTIFTDEGADTQPRRNVGADLFPNEEDLSGRVWGLSVYLEPTSDGMLQAVVSWRQELLRPLPLTYLVSWGRHSCNVNPDGPVCHLHDEDVTAEVGAKSGQEMKLVVSELTYNSKYRLDVGFEDTSPEQVYFYTPVCRQPGPSFTVCHDQPATYPTTTTTTTDSTTTTTADTTPVTSTSTQQPGRPHAADMRGSRGENWNMMVLIAAVCGATVVVIVVVVLMYRSRRRHDLNQQMLKAIMQSYASLPQAESQANLSRLLQTPIGHASTLMDPNSSLLMPAHFYQSLDGLDRLAATPAASPRPAAWKSTGAIHPGLLQVATPQQQAALHTLPPLRNIHLGVSSVLQTPPPTTPGSAPSCSPAPGLVSPTPRMGTRVMHVTENPLAALEDADPHPALATLAAMEAGVGGFDGRSRSMESLNRVWAGLGLPQVTRKAASTANLVLHGWDRGTV